MKLYKALRVSHKVREAREAREDFFICRARSFRSQEVEVMEVKTTYRLNNLSLLILQALTVLHLKKTSRASRPGELSVKLLAPY